MCLICAAKRVGKFQYLNPVVYKTNEEFYIMSEGDTRDDSSKNHTDESKILNASINSGINAVHVNTAREMTQLHTRARLPIHLQAKNENRNSSMPKPQRKPLMSSTFPKSNSNVSIPAKSHTGSCNNPQCTHCGQVIIPSPKSSLPIQDHPSITVNDWSIFTIKRPILNSTELDDLADSRFEFPLPEMIFGNNLVKLVNDKDGSSIEFNALDALDSLDEESSLKVSYHKEWLESRRSPSTASSSDIIDKSEKAQKEITNKDLKKLTDLDSLKPYDWTYSTNYKGTIKNVQFSETDEKIPVEKLLRPDPILFFDELILFEDELGDNGISMLSTKIRVMPTCLLLLCRFSLRIDNVIFRIRDTRIYIDFDTNLILREYKVQECSYSEVLKKISNKSNNDPKKLLRDTMWVSQNIPILSCTVESNTI